MAALFTGIIEEVGQIREMRGGVIRVAAQKVLSDVQVGDSIAVNGTCLTVTDFTREEFLADLVPETIRRTSFAELGSGSPVNLERAVLPTTRMGGHFVSGHIDGTGKILSLTGEGNALLMKVQAGPEILRGIVEKGSVALDGISLTVAEVTDTDFTVSLIPHTREVTNLGSKKAGSLLNIETDMLGKYVERLLTFRAPAGTKAEPALTADFLHEYGF